MPAGAISMFGPGTKSLLTEGLRKRRPSTSEDSEKSEEVCSYLIWFLVSWFSCFPSYHLWHVFHSLTILFDSLQNGPSSDIKIIIKPTEKPQTRGLFSDDEDAQVWFICFWCLTSYQTI